ETLHPVRLGRTFALATREVTVGQYRRFVRAHPRIPIVVEVKQYSSSPECPIIGETWYEAAAYCRWLGEQEGVPEDQQCYPSVEEILAAGERGEMAMYPDYLRRTGY